jgi:hypothetical protein
VKICEKLKISLPYSKLLFLLRKLWEIFLEVFLRQKIVPHPPKIKEKFGWKKKKNLNFFFQNSEKKFPKFFYIEKEISEWKDKPSILKINNGERPNQH